MLLLGTIYARYTLVKRIQSSKRQSAKLTTIISEDVFNDFKGRRQNVEKYSTIFTFQNFTLTTLLPLKAFKYI